MSSNSYGRTFISFDWALKRLLRNKASFVILEGFLSELLGIEIKILRLLESESNGIDENDKTNRVDLLCENDQNELIIIELQYQQERDYFQRMLYGTAKLIAEYLHRGDPYGNVKKLYAIHIVYFDLGHGDDYVYRGTLVFQGINKGDLLKLKNRGLSDSKEVGVLFPEYFILKVNNFNLQAASTLDEWIYYLKTSELPRAYSAKGLREIEEKLKFDAMLPEQKAKYQKYLDERLFTESMLETAWEEGEAKGIEKGIEIGYLNALIKSVIAAHKRGLSVTFIAELFETDELKVMQIIQEFEADANTKNPDN
jgi:predicted transposase/invertase (TIGR01784 family)